MFLSYLQFFNAFFKDLLVIILQVLVIYLILLHKKYNIYYCGVKNSNKRKYI